MGIVQTRSGLALFIVAIACNPPPTPLPGETGVATTGTSSGMEATTGSDADSESTAATTETAGDGDDGTFVPGTDGGDSPCPACPECQGWCDPWVIGECGAGFKCAAVGCEPASASWDEARCVPLLGEAEPGEPCEMFGPYNSGLDTCREGAMCWFVDVATMTGTCVALCGGTPTAPSCPAGSVCTISGNAVPTPCLPTCDPFADPLDCPPGHLCAPLGSASEGWRCILDASGGNAPYGSPCEFPNSCNPGTICVASESVASPSCGTLPGCCAELCDLSAPTPCPGEPGGEQCVPFYEPGTAPPGYENVGVCALPMP